jgi:DNA repair exonuclease SbcCD ATPase subunit
MRRSGLFIVLFAFIASGFLVGCSDKKKAEKEEFQKQAEAKLNELNKKMDELKNKGEKATDEIKAQIKEQMEELKKKQEAANKKLQELKSAGTDAWEKLKSETNKALDDMEKLYNDLKSRLT